MSLPGQVEVHGLFLGKSLWYVFIRYAFPPFPFVIRIFFHLIIKSEYRALFAQGRQSPKGGRNTALRKSPAPCPATFFRIRFSIYHTDMPLSTVLFYALFQPPACTGAKKKCPIACEKRWGTFFYSEATIRAVTGRMNAACREQPPVLRNRQPPCGF